MNIIVICLVIMGLLFFFGGTVGVLRFPDFYTRLHAAGKLDTLGSLAALLGLAIYTLAHPEHVTYLDLLTALKIMLIVVFLFLASPTATHAIVNAGMDAGLAPWFKNKK